MNGAGKYGPIPLLLRQTERLVRLPKTQQKLAAVTLDGVLSQASH